MLADALYCSLIATLCVSYCRDVEVHVATHAAGGLTMFDFVLAAKIDNVDVSGMAMCCHTVSDE